MTEMQKNQATGFGSKNIIVPSAKVNKKNYSFNVNLEVLSFCKNDIEVLEK